MNVYDELCEFALLHRSCGKIQARVDPATQWRYRVLLTCTCGAALRRSVTQEDASADLLPSTPPRFAGRTSRPTRRRGPRYGVAPSRVRPPAVTGPFAPGASRAFTPAAHAHEEAG